ncbi:MAG: hypothetical protein ABI167_11400 [Nitrosospira sp.]
MMKCIHSARTILALLIVALTVATGTATSLPARADTGETPAVVPIGEKSDEMKQADNEKHRKKIREENDRELKLREPLYPQQARSLAKRYKETAAIVARQGGNPRPLLDAASYFEKGLDNRVSVR